MKVLLVDNYDSFTYNLLHYLEATGVEVVVKRNDDKSLFDITDNKGVVLSPGPGLPTQAGQLMAIIKKLAGQIPLLGICLGHQAIAQVFGGNLFQLDNVLHGVTSQTQILNPKHFLFSGLPEKFITGHYHSWAVDESSLPSCLTVTARNETGFVMGLAHKTLDICGLQFHPESILTQHGMQIIENWVNHLSRFSNFAS